MLIISFSCVVLRVNDKNIVVTHRDRRRPFSLILVLFRSLSARYSHLASGGSDSALTSQALSAQAFDGFKLTSLTSSHPSRSIQSIPLREVMLRNSDPHQRPSHSQTIRQPRIVCHYYPRSFSYHHIF